MPQPQVHVDVDVEAARRLGVEQRAMSSDLIPDTFDPGPWTVPGATISRYTAWQYVVRADSDTPEIPLAHDAALVRVEVAGKTIVVRFDGTVEES